MFTNPHHSWQSDYPSNHYPILRPLATTPSLTIALNQLANFSVQVNFLGQGTAGTHFTDGLPPNRSPVFIREVNLLLNQQIVVWAQSECAIGSHWQQIVNCGQTPLGKILFQKDFISRRSPFEFLPLSGEFLFARRSWFEKDGEKLYLIECFKPEILAFL